MLALGMLDSLNLVPFGTDHGFLLLAPNAPLRSVVTALAPAAVPPAPISAATREAPRHRAAARYLWSMLLARIYEAFPLLCSICRASMRVIALVNNPAAVSKILDHIGESTQPPHIVPARGAPLWEMAMVAKQARNDPQRDSSAQSAPEIEFDQASPGRSGTVENQDEPPLVKG